jgi:hypothetical protein
VRQNEATVRLVPVGSVAFETFIVQSSIQYECICDPRDGASLHFWGWPASGSQLVSATLLRLEVTDECRSEVDCFA